MSNYKEQLSKHEELINKYKDLYLNENSNKSLNESSNNRNNFSNSNSIPININNTTNNIMMNNSFNKFNNTDIEKSIEFHSENNHIGISDFSSNKKNNNSNIINPKDINVEQSLERINNLLAQLNSKNETPNKKNSNVGNNFDVNNMRIKNDNSEFDNVNINKNRNNENNEINLDNNNINNINYFGNKNTNINKKFINDINNNNYNFKYGQLTIDNILAKYRNNPNQRNLFNTFNKFNINENNNNDMSNPFMLTFQQNPAKINPFNAQENMMNNLDKILQNKNINNINNINSNYIQKIKAKYLFNNDSITNKIAQKNTELSGLEKKLNFYKIKLFSTSAPEDNYINLKLDIKNINLNSNTENSYTLNSKNNHSINLNTSEINPNPNNSTIPQSDKSFSFKNNFKECEQYLNKCNALIFVYDYNTVIDQMMHYFRNNILPIISKYKNITLYIFIHKIDYFNCNSILQSQYIEEVKKIKSEIEQLIYPEYLGRTLIFLHIHQYMLFQQTFFPYQNILLVYSYLKKKIHYFLIALKIMIYYFSL